MRKFLSSLLIVLVFFTFLKPQDAQAQMPVKAKAFLTIVGYGTAGERVWV
jgi:hypothetical protein